MNHQPWDDGVLRIFLGERNRHRSIKTYCGKRVLFAQADERRLITCVGCRTKLGLTQFQKEAS